MNWKNPKLRDDVYRMMTLVVRQGRGRLPHGRQISAISKTDDMPDGPLCLPVQQYGNYTARTASTARMYMRI